MTEKQKSKFFINNWIETIDKWPLYWLVLPLLALELSYYLLLGKDCVIEINDQLDEFYPYVLNAKYLFTGITIFPELLGGMPSGGMDVAWVFVPLYRIFPMLTAFMIQFAIEIAVAYLGMYALVKELSKSSIIAAICGAMLMFLPFRQIFGLTIVGIPMVFYAFLCLYQRKHLAGAYLMVAFFTVGSFLALSGYAVFGFAVLAGIVAGVRILRKKIAWKETKHFFFGILEMFVLYILSNYQMIKALVVPNGDTVSQREEMVITGEGFRSALTVFVHSGQHIPSMHQYLIAPIAVLLVLYAFRYRKMDAELRRSYQILAGLFLVNILIALFYGFYESAPAITWRNSMTGFFHNFRANRVYWLYPTTWYLAAGLAMNLIWRYHSAQERKHRWPALVSFLLIGAILFPTAWTIRQNSNWLLNKSQYKNHKSVGLISWSDFYAEDLMTEIKDYIGKDQSTYKVASLGMCPATPLQAGFYCIDGYASSYSLEYKKAFRKIIAAELDACPAMKTYYDDWGNRCYLLTRESQNYYLIKKDSGFQYKELALDTQAMKDLGCEYIFSAAEITDADSMHLKLEKTFSTDDSYYEVWLYKIQ